MTIVGTTVFRVYNRTRSITVRYLNLISAFIPKTQNTRIKPVV